MEIRRLYPRTPKLYLPAIQFLRRLAQRKVTCIRRVPQNPRLLHLPSQRLRSISLKCCRILVTLRSQSNLDQVAMRLKSSVICGLIGSSVLLIVQLFYFILNTYVEYVEDGYSIYDSIPKQVFTVLGIAIVLAWLLIVCFFVGLLKKTK